MNWSDERYVRVYTRDTADWVDLGWEAQALLLLLMRKVDRAGVLDLGRRGEAGLANLLRMPLDVLQRSLVTLEADGCVTRSHTGSQLVLPNFLAAQEARQSDRQRQHESRARRRDAAKSATTMESRHTASRAVTDVTSGHSVPYRTVPYSDLPEEIFTSGSGSESGSGSGQGGTGSGTEDPGRFPPLPTDPPPALDRANAPAQRPRPQEPRPQFGAIAGSVSSPRVCARCGREGGATVLDAGRNICRHCYERRPSADADARSAALALAARFGGGPLLSDGDGE